MAKPFDGFMKRISMSLQWDRIKEPNDTVMWRNDIVAYRLLKSEHLCALLTLSCSRCKRSRPAWRRRPLQRSAGTGRASSTCPHYGSWLWGFRPTAGCRACPSPWTLGAGRYLNQHGHGHVHGRAWSPCCGSTAGGNAHLQTGCPGRGPQSPIERREVDESEGAIKINIYAREVSISVRPHRSSLLHKLKYAPLHRTITVSNISPPCRSQMVTHSRWLQCCVNCSVGDSLAAHDAQHLANHLIYRSGKQTQFNTCQHQQICIPLNT